MARYCYLMELLFRLLLQSWYRRGLRFPYRGSQPVANDVAGAVTRPDTAAVARPDTAAVVVARPDTAAVARPDSGAFAVTHARVR